MLVELLLKLHENGDNKKNYGWNYLHKIFIIEEGIL